MMNQIPTCVDDIDVDVVDGEVLLCRRSQTTAFYLNPGASMVIGLCDGRRTVEDITDLLADAYGGTRSDIAADVARIVAELQRNGILVTR